MGSGTEGTGDCESGIRTSAFIMGLSAYGPFCNPKRCPNLKVRRRPPTFDPGVVQSGDHHCSVCNFGWMRHAGGTPYRQCLGSQVSSPYAKLARYCCKTKGFLNGCFIGHAPNDVTACKEALSNLRQVPRKYRTDVFNFEVTCIAHSKKLQPEQYVESAELREWARKYRQSRFVPERLLKAWRLDEWPSDEME